MSETRAPFGFYIVVGMLLAAGALWIGFFNETEFKVTMIFFLLVWLGKIWLGQLRRNKQA